MPLPVTTQLLAVSAWAAPAAANTITEELTVLPHITVTVTSAGDIDYGDVMPDTWSATWEQFDGSVSSNAPVHVTFSATDFNGPVTLSKDIRLIYVDSYQVDKGLVYQGDGMIGYSASELEALAPLYASTGPVVDAPWGLDSKVKVPTMTEVGNYSGSMEFSFTNL
jgi:hypothetical protein